MPQFVFRWMPLGGLAAALSWVTSSASARESPPEVPPEDSSARCAEECGGDFDRDGIQDELERRTGTNPLRADTDGDTIPDGQEDQNHDGRVDPGESDPRSAGLFPGSAPHIPEPMLFDLVRGLGARRGELEVNALFVALPAATEPLVLWAPELEWAPFDDFAVELELPMRDRELYAVKGALQYTLPFPGEAFTHGVQWLGEGYLDQTGGATALLYLAGGRLGEWTSFSMLGARLVSLAEPAPHAQLLVNPSIYRDVGEKMTLGVETNVALGGGHDELRVVPQLHYQISPRFRLQLGGGFVHYRGQTEPLVATRLVLE